MTNNLDNYLQQQESIKNASRIDVSTAEQTLVNVLKRVISGESSIPPKIRYLLLFCIESHIDTSAGISVGVGFNRDAIYRGSLYAEKYDGADTDVLYNNGWQAKNYVYGTNRQGFRYRSKKDFNTTDFIRKAVRECARELGIPEQRFYINDIYDFYSPHNHVTHGVGNYIFE